MTLHKSESKQMADAQLFFPVFDRRGGVERVASECARYFVRRGYHTNIYARSVDRSVVGDAPVVHEVRCSSVPAVQILRFASAAQSIARQCPQPALRCGFGVQAPRDSVIWVPSVHAEWLRIARTLRTWTGRLRQVANPFHHAALYAERRAFTRGNYRHLIALTPRVKAELIEHYQVSPSDISVLPNGYNDREFNVAGRSHVRDRIRSQHGCTQDDQVVLFVANELERKGFEPLVRAISRLRSDRLKLWVVGRAPIARYTPLLDRLGLQGRVRYVGSTSRVADYFHAADVFALPTQYEAWGLVIIEALACGIPVVTSRLAGAASAVSEGQTGELLDDPSSESELAAKLQTVLDYPPLDADALEASVAALRWDAILPQYERIVCDAFAVEPLPSVEESTV